jgi:hypothetical protein
MGSGGSMVARLKLKEIDGRAPKIPHLWWPIMANLNCKIARPFNCMDSFRADLQPVPYGIGPQIKWGSSGCV